VVEGSTLKEYITNHYKSLYLSYASPQIEEVLRCISRRITNEINVALTKPFNEEEVWEALQSIGDLNSPGPDGISSIFYK